MQKVVLYQPDIAGNVGAIIRTCFCFGLELHIIEPCGFPFDIQKIKKSALDYFDQVEILRYISFDEFFKTQIVDQKKRLILATTKGSTDYRKFTFLKDDFLMFGRESAGVPDDVARKADHRIFIPMKNNARSLNIAISCGIILAKAGENFL